MSTFDPNDGFEDDEIENLTPAQVADAAAKRRIREAKEKNKELKTLQDELAELRKFRDEQLTAKRTEATASVFEELGLPKQQARYFLADNPDVTDVTKDLAAKWAKEAGWPVEEVVAEETAPMAFKPISSQSSTPVGSNLTMSEFKQALADAKGDERTLKALATAYEQGRVRPDPTK